MVLESVIKDAFDKITLSKDGGHRPTIIITATKCSVHLRTRPILPEREAYPYPTTHRVIFFLDLFHIFLVFLHFGVLSHILHRSEVVIVPCVDLGVESGDERCADGPEVVPFDAGEERMVSYLVQG